jgi:hypothetical protein
LDLHRLLGQLRAPLARVEARVEIGGVTGEEVIPLDGKGLRFHVNRPVSARGVRRVFDRYVQD